jgi:hypothetical protein
LRKISLVFSIFLLLNLFGCNFENGNERNLDDIRIKKIKISKEVKIITVTGNGLAIYSETENRLIDREIVIEQTEEIDVILKAIEGSSTHSGEMTEEGENYNLNITHIDGSNETILLWLYPDRNSGRIQKENYEGPVQILSKEDVQNIAKVLAEKM